MSRNNYKRKPDQDQDQDQDQKQDQKQAELQAQLQGQAQGQAQGQGQFQFAVQSVESKNDNENDNENKNENSNENKLDNKVDNDVDNSLDNKVENKLDNSVDNKLENSVENKVENKVNVEVDVKVDLDLSAFKQPVDNDVIDIDSIEHIYGSVVMPDVVDQKLDGNGNQFNIDQVNNLIDNDFLWRPEVSFDGKGDFKMEAKAEGGEAKIDDAKVDIHGDGASIGDSVTATADAIISQTAFTQNIVMGANIQFNQITQSVAGADFTDDHSI
jgi:hypothetical protein